MMMDKQEARVLFEEADRLYKSGNYIEALQHLSELRHEFPDDFNVLYPILLCREKLGRIEEAREMCNSMMERYTSAKPRTKLCNVYARLMDQQTAPQQNKEITPGNDFIKDEPYVVEAGGSELIELWGHWVPWKNILLGLIIAVCMIGFFVALPLLLPKDEEGVAVGANIVVLIMSLLLQYVLNCFTFYVGLWATNKLLHEDVVLDIIDVCIFGPIFGILASIPFFGWIFAYFILASRYEMGLLDLLFFIAVFLILNIAFVYLILPAIFGPAVFNFL